MAKQPKLDFNRGQLPATNDKELMNFVTGYAVDEMLAISTTDSDKSLGKKIADNERSSDKKMFLKAF